MIKTELLNKKTLIKHYSDKGMYLRQVQTGLLYAEPVDLNPCPYVYVETEEHIEQENSEI